jgi:sugar/nucleoside kinase (ribokinase family)
MLQRRQEDRGRDVSCEIGTRSAGDIAIDRIEMTFEDLPECLAMLERGGNHLGVGTSPIHTHTSPQATGKFTPCSFCLVSGMGERLIAVGEVMLDIASAELAPGETTHAPIRVRAGGSPVTAALWAFSCGIDATVVGRVGADHAGIAVRASIADAGVDPRLSVDPERPTGTFLEAGTGAHRAIVADRGANAGLSVSDIGELSAAAVLVSGYVLLHDDTAEAGRAAIERAATSWLAVDAGSAGLVTRLGAEAALGWMSGANAIFADADEAQALTGETGEAAATLLAERFRLVCVKLGAAGAVASLDGIVERRSPPERLLQGAAGAGDALAGVLLAGLVLGLDLGDALERACAAGTRAAAGRAPG